MTGSSPAPQKLTFTHWAILFVAGIGFLFDIYELLMTPLVAPAALSELLHVPLGSPEIRRWIGYIFWGSALAGGAFGLLGGYLTDRYGRRRVLVLSILLYAFSACAAAFSTSAWMLLVLRCTTFMGVCVEFVAAVAWLAELFPNPRQREAVLGYTQVFSSFGGLLVAAANTLIVAWAESLPAIHGAHASWRYTLMSGVIPAIPLMVIRPFLPESPAWQEKAARGELKRPSFFELFRPSFRRTTVTTTVLFACCYGAAFGAIQLAPAQMVPALPEIAPHAKQLAAARKEVEERATAAAALAAGSREHEQAVDALKTARSRMQTAGKPVEQARNTIQTYQELGGLTGRILLALLAMIVVSRRRLLWTFQIPGLLIVPLVFAFPGATNFGLLKYGIFLAGLFTVAQFSFWGNYLPRVFPMHLRGTGEGFAANVGGRMIGTSAAFWTTQLAAYMPGEKVAYAAAITAAVVYGVAVVVTAWLPEPAREELPE